MDKNRDHRRKKRARIRGWDEEDDESYGSLTDVVRELLEVLQAAGLGHLEPGHFGHDRGPHLLLLLLPAAQHGDAEQQRPGEPATTMSICKKEGRDKNIKRKEYNPGRTRN
jgi:hypothetical protein